MNCSTTIIGAGPAGLTAGYILAQNHLPVTLIEADAQYVGGIARTVNYKDFHFDIGGHRFFSKSHVIENFWSEILPEDMLIRPRTSRIFYSKKFFSYPLSFMEVLKKLGLFKSFLCFLSYLKAKIRPIKNPRSFEDWVTNHFGKHLFHIFFKTYTEKVWGIPCNKISADWAAQRIKGLSFMSAVIHSLRPAFLNKDKKIKSLIESFRYPRKGPGMLWEVCAEKIIAMGGHIEMGKKVVRVEYHREKNEWETFYQHTDGHISTIKSNHVISSAPLRELITDYLHPKPELSVIKAAEALQYRDFLIVALILKERHQFSDNWIYIHDPAVSVGRIQNFKSWSPEMVPDEKLACYGMEYFCFEGDGLWQSSDEALIQKAKHELIHIGLAKAEDILDGCVVRQPKAYPVYDDHYKKNTQIIRDALERQYPGLHLAGRNGMHKYNNQDHAMMTAMLTVKNIMAGSLLYDVWQVNQDAEYHETGQTNDSQMGLRQVPEKIMDNLIES